MAFYDPEHFGMFTPEQVLQKAQERFGGFNTGFYTISYQGIIQSGYSKYYRYALYSFPTNEVVMTGDVWTSNTSTQGCIKTGIISVALVSMGFYEVDGRLLQYSGSSTPGSIAVPLYNLSNGTLQPSSSLSWEQTNMFSTVKITNTTDSTYNYNPTIGLIDNIRLGTITPSGIYLGTEEAEIYLGTEKVWG